MSGCCEGMGGAAYRFASGRSNMVGGVRGSIGSVSIGGDSVSEAVGK